MEIYYRTDPFTNKEFKTTSAIKRFATKENQIAYNNQKARKAKKDRAYVNDKIEHNYIVLSSLLGDEDEVIVTEKQLKNEGFYFGVLTHYDKIKGTLTLGVYEYSYVQLENNNQFKISKNGKDLIA